MATRVETDNEIKVESIKTISGVKYEGHWIGYSLKEYFTSSECMLSWQCTT